MTTAAPQTTYIIDLLCHLDPLDTASRLDVAGAVKAADPNAYETWVEWMRPAELFQAQLEYIWKAAPVVDAGALARMVEQRKAAKATTAVAAPSATASAAAAAPSRATLKKPARPPVAHRYDGLVDADRVRDALSYLSPDCSRDEWVQIAMAVKNGLGDAGFDIWDQWSAQSDKYDQKDAHSTWNRSIKAEGKRTVGSLFYWAKDRGWKDAGERKKFTPAEIEAYKAAAAARQAKEAETMARRRADAAKRAQEITATCKPVTAEDEPDPYSKLKSIKPVPGTFIVPRWTFYDTDEDGVVTERVESNCLMVPVRNRKRELVSLQVIDARGNKRHLKDGAKSGNFFTFGAAVKDELPEFILAEGFATSASVHEATGKLTLCTFDADNMVTVARAIRSAKPGAKITIAADWDIETKGNPGYTKAVKVAQEIGALLAVPQLTGMPEKKADFNDVHFIEGADAVRTAIAAAVLMVPPVVIAPTMRDARGVEFALMLAHDIEAEVARAEGPSPPVALEPYVLSYEKVGVARAVEAARNLWPRSEIRILAEHRDAAQAQRAAEPHGAQVDVPPDGDGWRGWGQHFLGIADDLVDGLITPALRADIDAELVRIADGAPVVAREMAERAFEAVAAPVVGELQVDTSVRVPETQLNENDVSQHAKNIADTIAWKLAKAFNIERDDPNYQKQIDAFGIKVDVIERMIRGSFWSGARSKLFFLNKSQSLNQYTADECYKFLVRAFGSPVDAKVIEAATETAATHPGMSKGTAKELRSAVSEAVGGTIIDHLKFWNQRNRVEWRTDMFAEDAGGARMQLIEDKARVVLAHRPFEAPGKYDQAIIDDYKQHFSRYDEFLQFLVMSRFVLDRKKCYLWILADSDWGKGFMLGVLTELGLAVCTSEKEIEAIFEGKPVGRDPSEFKRAFALVVDEFKTVKSEMKQLQSEIKLSPKHELVSNVEIFAKLFLSAENVGSLATQHGVEDQFANRMSIFKETGDLTRRPLYMQVGNPRYFASVLAYTAETLNRLVAEMQAMGRLEAQTCAERWVNGFIERHGLDTHFARFSESIPQLAAEALIWMYKQGERLVQDGNGMDSPWHLMSPGKALDDYISAHFDPSEAPGYRKKKQEILRLMSADGRGVGTHRINGKPMTSVVLMKAGSSADDLSAKKPPL